MRVTPLWSNSAGIPAAYDDDAFHDTHVKFEYTHQQRNLDYELNDATMHHNLSASDAGATLAALC